MTATTKFTNATKGIPQHGTNWCIPASIENLLRSEGITDITQEQLIYKHLLSHSPQVSLSNGATIILSSIPKYEALELFRCPPIPQASFQTFAPITNTMLQQSGLQHKLDLISNINSNSDYVKELLSILAKDKPVLISASNQSGFHITVTYDCDGTNIHSYDPGRDEHLSDLVSQYTFSHDLLFLK